MTQSLQKIPLFYTIGVIKIFFLIPVCFLQNDTQTHLESQTFQTNPKYIIFKLCFFSYLANYKMYNGTLSIVTNYKITLENAFMQNALSGGLQISLWYGSESHGNKIILYFLRSQRAYSLIITNPCAF